MKYFYDTEFLEDGRTVELISIGIVADDGREYYAVNADMPVDRISQHAWLMENVVPTLPMKRPEPRALLGVDKKSRTQLSVDRTSGVVKPRWVIANEVRAFLLRDGVPELWADYCAHDHVVLCQLWGRMIDLPPGIPMWTHELEQLWESAGKPQRPVQESGQHNALEDARWNRELYRVCAKPLGKPVSSSIKEMAARGQWPLA